MKYQSSSEERSSRENIRSKKRAEKKQGEPSRLNPVKKQQWQTTCARGINLVAVIGLKSRQ